MPTSWPWRNLKGQAYPGSKVLVASGYKPEEVRYVGGQWQVTHVTAVVQGTSGN